MAINKDRSKTATVSLRRRAEDQLLANDSEAKFPKAELQTQKLLHELEIHRIQLEMQNAELRQARDNAEQSLEKYEDLYEFAPVGYLTLGFNGTINAMNFRAASLLGVARPQLVGQRFDLLVMDKHRPLFTNFFDNIIKNRDKTVCEVALKKEGNPPFFAQLEAMVSSSGKECGLALIDITERKQAEDDLRSYASRLIILEEELRNNVATELHDEISRDLTVLGMNLAIISDGMTDIVPKKLLARVKVSRKLTKGISHTVRNIMVGLRPPVLDDYGLLAALRWHADNFSTHTGIAVSVLADEPFPRLTIEKEASLFRISQEALTNALKHAATRIVTIKLKRIDGMLWFAVVDEGKGFLPAGTTYNQHGYGWGIRIMRERAELMGGKFTIESVPGKGTTVSVIMPLEAG